MSEQVAPEPKKLPSACTENEDGSIKVDLVVPVKHGSEELREITLKRLKGRHMRALKVSKGGGMSMDQLLTVGGKVSGLPPAVIDDLDAVDCVVVAEVVGHFFEHGPPTGGTS